MTVPDAARVDTSLPASNDGKRGLDVGRQFARLEPVEQRLALGVRRGPRVEPLLPRGVGRGAALAQGAGVLEDVVGDREGLLGVEAQDLLRRGELVAAEGGAVDLAGVLLAGRRASR